VCALQGDRRSCEVAHTSSGVTELLVVPPPPRLHWGASVLRRPPS
jgi:hypothetical protein